MRQHTKIFALDCFKLAPEVFEKMRVQHWNYRAVTGYVAPMFDWAFLFCLMGLVGNRSFSGFVLVGGFVAHFILWYIVSKMPPDDVQLDSLQTFRDLSVRIASQSSAI